MIAVILLTGCAVQPASPPAVTPAGAAGSFVGARDDVTRAPVPPGWWKLFNDPVLDAHIARALSTNADLRVAIANLEVARAAIRQTRAARLPGVGVESGVGSIDAKDQPSSTMVPTTDYDIGVTVAYEADLFGRLRSATAAAGADAAASSAALDAARVAVVADTVSAYVDVCGAMANARVAKEQVVAQQRSVDLVAGQLREGEVSPLELAQARALLIRAEAVPLQFEADSRRALFRLAALQGLSPAAADSLAIGCTAVPTMSAGIPVGDGAALIARRPDIREAEHRLAAATARIGVATADLYPRIQLGGSAGMIGGVTDAFLTPLISWVFLDRSGARTRINSARGAEAAALANWDVVMLRALREVETALADYSAERARRAVLALALVESDKVATRARVRFDLGADSYLLVLDAERTRNEAGSQLAASDLRIAQIQVLLFRALGGGWE